MNQAIHHLGRNVALIALVASAGCGGPPEVPSNSGTNPPPSADLQTTPPPPPVDMKQLLPDLTVTASLRSYTRVAEVALCLNLHPDGTPRSDGNQITVKNIGQGPAGAYGVAFGVVNSADSKKVYACSARPVDKDGLDPGQSAQWSAPLCCALRVPGGQSYRIFVIADDKEQVTESNENNNVALSSQSFPVPSSLLPPASDTADGWADGASLMVGEEAFMVEPDHQTPMVAQRPWPTEK